MNNVYVIYGQGPCGKTTFVRNVMDGAGNMYVNDFRQFSSYEKRVDYNQRFNNVIIDEITNNELELKRMGKDILNHNFLFNNLILVCSDLNNISALTDMLRCNDVRIKYLNFNDNSLKDLTKIDRIKDVFISMAGTQPSDYHCRLYLEQIARILADE